MAQYKSTDIFIEQLVSGEYPRPVLENDETEIDFDEVADNFVELVSQPGHYDYLQATKVGE